MYVFFAFWPYLHWFLKDPHQFYLNSPNTNPFIKCSYQLLAFTSEWYAGHCLCFLKLEIWQKLYILIPIKNIPGKVAPPPPPPPPPTFIIVALFIIVPETPPHPPPPSDVTFFLQTPQQLLFLCLEPPTNVHFLGERPPPPPRQTFSGRALRKEICTHAHLGYTLNFVHSQHWSIHYLISNSCVVPRCSSNKFVFEIHIE